ncbi:MAG TPA: hypothetical protein VME63_00305 [Dyella sp.]|uniref:hypothetical protein n=1 Tax=Dyella sp. TaxID=1869338 RepID=UPI002BB104F2|nr:hypothetical protein [Dyella sp.]HTV83818.1 hypothetical protein [Dyella sp.]
MKFISKVCVALLFVVLLCGLSSRFAIVVSQSQGQAPSFVIKRTSHGLLGESVEINSFSVVKKNDAGQWDYKHPVWAFDLPPGTGKELSKVNYGQVPAGFIERTKALKLTSGITYLVLGFGLGSDGSVQFVAK